MKYLVICATDNGFSSFECDFVHNPPTINDVIKAQKDIQKRLHLTQMPVIINWLPLSETEE